MTASVARAQAKRLIDFVPEDKISSIVRYIQSLTAKNRAETVNPAKKAAYEVLLADAQPAAGAEISMNGAAEAADFIIKKYESLN